MKITWNDIKNGSQKDLKRIYKVNDRQLEMSVRKHLDGANSKERREAYQQFYSRSDS